MDDKWRVLRQCLELHGVREIFYYPGKRAKCLISCHLRPTRPFRSASPLFPLETMWCVHLASEQEGSPVVLRAHQAAHVLRKDGTEARQGAVSNLERIRRRYSAHRLQLQVFQQRRLDLPPESERAWALRRGVACAVLGCGARTRQESGRRCRCRRLLLGGNPRTLVVSVFIVVGLCASAAATRGFGACLGRSSARFLSLLVLLRRHEQQRRRGRRW